MEATALTSPPRRQSADHVPLVVGLDATLLRTESMIESIFVLARSSPLSLIKLPFWWLRGRAALRQWLAQAALPDVQGLPYRAELVAFLLEQKKLGRRLVLATEANERLAHMIAAESGLFDEVLASDTHQDLSGQHKRDQLISRYGWGGFDYIGSSPDDLPVWAAARQAVLVSPSALLEQRVATLTPISRIFRDRAAQWRDYLAALRPRHWVKNVLVFMPLALAHGILEPQLLGRALLAFVAFSLCASGQYLLNDLLDLQGDRRHPQKKTRAIASGRVHLGHALWMMPALLIGAFAVALGQSMSLAGLLAVYLLLMASYSMKLKYIAMLDVLVLACGYALRVAAGAVAVRIDVSAWLLTFCVFLFFSLALIKRYSEIMILESVPGATRIRGYWRSDKVLLVTQGVASGYLAVLVLALYTNAGISGNVYAQHESFWPICLLLLYWVSYLWMVATRGGIREDPVVFALTDRMSLGTIALMGLFAFLAL